MVSPKCQAIQQFAYMKSCMGQSSSGIRKTCINCNFAVFVGHEMTFVGYSLEIHGGYVYGVASQKRYIGQVHRFGALCTAPNSVHWCTEFSALVHRI